MPHIANGTFAQVIRAYKNSAHFRGLEPTTQESYARPLLAAEAHDGLGGLPVELLRPSLIQAFLDAFADSPGTQSVAKVALGALEKWAIVRDLLPREIMTGTTVLGSDGGHEPWTLEQVALAEHHARPDLARVVTLAVHLGQRGSDIVRMRRSHICNHAGRLGINVTQKKTGRRLWVPFTAELAEKIQTWVFDDYLVTNRRGKPYAGRPELSWSWNAERDSNPLLKSLAGLTMHGLRATAVVRARKGGLSVLQISNMYGMSEQMVARYSRLADQTDMALAAVATLDRIAAERTVKTTDQKVVKFRR